MWEFFSDLLKEAGPYATTMFIVAACEAAALVVMWKEIKSLQDKRVTEAKDMMEKNVNSFADINRSIERFTDILDVISRR